MSVLKVIQLLGLISVVAGTTGCNVGVASGGARPADWKPGPGKPPGAAGKGGAAPTHVATPGQKGAE